MYTKSLIQQHLERIDLLESFKLNLNDIMDKYIIENSVFGVTRNGSVCEITNGYFIEEDKYNSLDECIRGLKDNQYINILNNETFIAGVVENSLFNCPEQSKVLDLETLKYVR